MNRKNVGVKVVRISGSCLDAVHLADVISKDLHESLLCGAGAVRQEGGHSIIDGVCSGIDGDRLRGCVGGVDRTVLQVDGTMFAQHVAGHDLFVH